MCSLDKLAWESQQTVDLTCHTPGGEEYNMTRTRFIEKGGRCTAECPNGTMPGPHEGTDCLFGGRWSHRINCYKPCPDIDLGHGVLVVEGRNTSNRKLEGTGYDCSGGPYVTGTTE